MPRFNKKLLKENYLFLLIALGVVIVFLLLSFFLANNKVKEEVLPTNGKSNISKLVINEVSSNNSGTIMAPDGGIYDWVEIYNGKSRDVNLTNYSLSDTTSKIKWVFPENTIIKSGEYLVVFLSGKTASGLIANFKLSSSGSESLILRNSSKNIIDAVELEPLTNTQVMARNLNGSWHVYNKTTPGFLNTLEGYNAYLSSIQTDATNDLVINEVLPNNKGRFKNLNDEYSGYIELKNTGSKTINLSNYAISNDEAKPFKYNLPNVDLASGEIFLIFTSGASYSNDGEYSASFALKSKTGVAVLSYKGKIIEMADYENMANGLALVKESDDFVESNDLSPGFNNSSKGIESYQKKYLQTSDTLIISEVMTSNYSYLPQNGSKYYDFIELYNNSKKDLNLSDYCLGKEDTSCNDKLPNITLKPGEYYIFMASGDRTLSNNSYKHLDFKIGDNDTIYLFKAKTIIDTLFIPELDPGYSYGKNTSYGEYYYSSPTPLTNNSTGIIAISTPPTFSEVGGIYNDVNSLKVTLNGEGTIYYTTDGSKPTNTSNKYSEPLKLTKTTVIKAITTNNDKRNSSVITNSYIINENHTVPVMSISLDKGNFSYLNKNAWTVGIEVPSYVEFFENGSGFKLGVGLRLFGGTTRGPAKKSYALKFNKENGSGTLNYQVFSNRDYATFEDLVLRTASQDEDRAIIRDLLGTSLVDGVTKAYVQAYKTIILYVNGEYWGLYYIREKTDENYVSNNFNINASGTDVLRIDGELKSGTRTAYNSLVSYINSHDLSNDEYYDYVASLIDIDSFIDFWVAETYVTNNDIVNYRYFRNPNLDDGKWKFVFYDLDWAFYNYEKNYYAFATSSSGMTPRGYSTVLLRNLVKNKKFQKRFVERVSYQLKNVWNNERVNAKMNEILNELEPELERNFTRWNLKREDFEYQLGRLKTYLAKRKSYMISQTKAFFNLTDEEMEYYFGE